jgi:Cu+-exporting ATPase
MIRVIKQREPSDLRTHLQAEITRTRENRYTCYHCGEPCADDRISAGDKIFCCRGCRLVFELLSEHDLCAYYDLSRTPGIAPVESGIITRFEYLDDIQVQRQLLDFDNGTVGRITFKLPAMHCSSCIWLLENLYKVNEGISSSPVNFLRREITITFNPEKISLRQIVELLTSLGYEPEINLASLEQKVRRESTRSLYLKIGIAGFAFGNIMLLSFPDYLALNDVISTEFSRFFGFLSLLLALPVLFYSSSDYFHSAFNGLKQKSVNMDVPVSLGIIVLFIRSSYEIITTTGTGFIDSFTGLVFLLLIGKLFQKKTYDSLSFERDYRSYFPISVIRKTAGTISAVAISNLKIRDRILIRNQELIPADSVLIKGEGNIDYSFVTGEAQPVPKVSGDLIYAGGRQAGGTLELEVVKEVSQSYLTGLWNTGTFTGGETADMSDLSNRVSKYFTYSVLLISILAAFFWLPGQIARAFDAFTAVLIIACPCALALSTPFTLGNVLRIFGRNGFYLRNTSVVESLARISMIVFDKTGTLTRSEKSRLKFHAASGENARLTKYETERISALCLQSTHPLSRFIAGHLKTTADIGIRGFREITGQGIAGTIDDIEYRIGSYQFIGLPDETPDENQESLVHVSVAGRYRGCFSIAAYYRPGLEKMIGRLQRQYETVLLTGDNEQERNNLRKLFGSGTDIHFRQSPYDKLNYVRSRRDSGARVLMIGDGLNDAGALRESDTGISISEEVHTFSPASDAILDANSFTHLPDFLKFSRMSIYVIISSFILSFIYNLIGLTFAVQGTLSPLIAAILMPLSSISVVLYTTGATTVIAHRLHILPVLNKEDNIN